MNLLKSWLNNTSKASRHFKRAVVVVIIPLSVLGGSIGSSVGQIRQVPAIATFPDWEGFIRMRRGNGQATLINKHSFLKRDIDVLEVAGSTGGNEHWAHLQFRTRNSSIPPLVQAGTDSSPTEYRFPCYFRSGGVVVGWGLRRRGRNACQRIIIDSSQGKSSITNTTITHKSMLGESSEDTLIAQIEFEQLSVKPSNGSTLIYINQEFGSTVVNVLVGNVTIKSTSGSTIVRQGIRYTDTGDGSRGDTSPVPPEIYNSRPVQIFLDPTTWSADVSSQIQDFQVAVDRHLNPPQDDADRVEPTPIEQPPRRGSETDNGRQTPPSPPDETPPSPPDETPPSPPDETPPSPPDETSPSPPDETSPSPPDETPLEPIDYGDIINDETPSSPPPPR